MIRKPPFGGFFYDFFTNYRRIHFHQDVPALLVTGSLWCLLDLVVVIGDNLT
ncbi:hypothetical protein ACOZB2_03995 [Pantoea endophytica]